MNGRIDEVGIWKRVLTSDERTAIYNGGAGLPLFNAYANSATIDLSAAAGAASLAALVGSGSLGALSGASAGGPMMWIGAGSLPASATISAVSLASYLSTAVLQMSGRC